MSEFKCPIETCGRILQSANVLKQHLRRRHPAANLEAINGGEEDRVVQEEINKLPKIRTLKMQAGEHKLPDLQRRSTSKGKIDSSSVNTSKMTSVISESRSIIETTEHLAKNGRRPSLNKRPLNNNLDRHDKLPELKPLGKPKKLQLLNDQIKLKKSESQEMEQAIMYSTAPNFKKLQKKESKIREKSSSKEKIESMIELDIPSKKAPANELLLIKTQQGFHEKQVRMHKTLRRASDKLGDRSLETHSMLVEPKREEKLIKQQLKPEHKEEEKKEKKEEKGRQTQRKSIEVKAKNNRREASLRRTQPKQQASTSYNFEERIIVFNENVGPKLSIPANAKVQFVYANNCKLSFISLGGVEYLRQLSLQHNLLKDLSFLNYPANSNIEKLFVDHNQLTSIDYLPPSLKVFSAAFNNIQGLEISGRELSKSANLIEVDFSFNPLRKESNYKLHIISSCTQLKKIDGMKLTKFDFELASEYSRILDEELGLIPSSKSKDLIISRCSQSPSTVISSGEQPEVEDVSQEELEKEIKKLQKLISHTTDHLKIIRNENKIIQAQISQLNEHQEDNEGDFTTLYNKLRAECAALQLLNFLQWADEDELLELIEKKKVELSSK